MNQEIETISKSPKRKILGIPLAVFIILGAGMVLAATILYISYTHSFTKTINIFSNGTSPVTEYVTITGSGDLSNSLINCDMTASDTCSITSGDIVLTNGDLQNSHVCVIVTVGDLNVSYDVNGAITNNNVFTPTIPINGSVTFKVDYTGDGVGVYRMSTTISCLT